MKLTWIHAVLLTISIFVLAGCGKTVEEQVSKGLENAETTFEEEPAKANEEVGNLKFYKPFGFHIEQGDTKTNYVLTKGKDTYLLFVNPNETSTSQLNYDLLMDDKTKVIKKQETFEQDGAFGFSAIVEQGENEFEVIVSIGGVKMTMISDNRKLDDHLETMMEIVRSVKVDKV